MDAYNDNRKHGHLLKRLVGWSLVAGVAAALSASPVPGYPMWDGKESVAEYAKRVDISEISITVDLGQGVTLPLTLIPAGTYAMGAVTGKKGEQPVHTVTISQPFYMGLTPVTEEQLARLQDRDASAIADPKVPARETWDAAVGCCRKVGEKAGRIGRLPTEAEWEFACRAGTTSSYYFGDDDPALTRLVDHAWTQANSAGRLQPVGLKQPNPWGLFDLYGPVFQWVSDWYAPYAAEPQADPRGPAQGKARVLRGTDIDRAPGKSSSRTSHPPSATARFGFRVVLEVR